MISEKLYRDPVHDLISLNKRDRGDALIMRLIDTPEMQRLRRIRQLGLAWLAYQGAEHSRFTHSLGVMWIATRILERLQLEARIAPLQVVATRCAALLHDIGHGPMSHLFENFLGLNHEHWTARIIMSPESETNRILRGYDSRLPGLIVEIIDGKSQPRFLSQIISSQLDADRFDYLLRDSIMTGVKYGIYDFERVLHILRLDHNKENIVIAANGVHPVEKYLQSRYHMYSQVYLHKTVRAAEVMLVHLLRRAKDLLREDKLPTTSVDPSIISLLRLGAKVPMQDFLDVDDHEVLSCIKRWSMCGDSILCDLSRRLLERRIFKALDISKITNSATRIRTAEAVMLEAGLDPKYYLAIDAHGNVPYSPYNPRRPGEENHIRVKIREDAHEYRDIHEVSDVVRGLTRAAFTRKQAIFPEKAGRVNLRARLNEVFFG